MNHGDTLSSIHADRIAIKQAMLACNPIWRGPKPQTWRFIRDIAFDWLMVFASVWATHRIGWMTSPIALVVIGNRQRAIGNLLHEASHGNLSTHRHTNDYLAHLLLAPPLLNSLPVYRALHARHHAWLGDPQRDPDLLPSLTRDGDQWHDVYVRCLMRFSIFRGSLVGHFSNGKLTGRQRLGILAWWMITSLTLAAINPQFSIVFLILWFGSRITIFHAITTFREMTDHYGLEPGSIFGFTREIPDHGPLSTLLHPHHNGYHLTHHLFPTVPYHQLPSLHKQLMRLNEFTDQAKICKAYLVGPQSSVFGWGAHHG
ncbi:fatty acid desaturase [Paraburkholderia sp. Ac-20336]|uniref:fatty acid desaturase family protein n=1 Tax=Paraburkholderia sp. Ac-20336 TaxID=2703886 RepID=UPI00197D85C4|nr:fatty acid desaturase [Paraburkholderia sp. Ac-20336]MBN3804362.1 fatty acid desaturase [Paraburkholderia sp. Ac-20336]